MLSPEFVNRNQQGFGLIEVALIIIVVGVLGATGWYSLHTKHQTDQILSQADKISQEIPLIKSTGQIIKSFDECQKAKDSKILQTFPEVCVTSSGQRFTQ